MISNQMLDQNLHKNKSEFQYQEMIQPLQVPINNSSNAVNTALRQSDVLIPLNNESGEATAQALTQKDQSKNNATVLRDSVTSKPDASNIFSALDQIKSDLQFFNKKTSDYPKDKKQNYKNLDSRKATWKLSTDEMTSKKRKSTDAHPRSSVNFMHRQFIPKKTGRLNSAMNRLKKFQNTLYDVKPKNKKNQEGLLSSQNSQNQMANEIENDIAQQIQDFEDFKNNINMLENKASQSSDISSDNPDLVKAQNIKIINQEGSKATAPVKRLSSRNLIVTNKFHVSSSNRNLIRPKSSLANQDIQQVAGNVSSQMIKSSIQSNQDYQNRKNVHLNSNLIDKDNTTIQNQVSDQNFADTPIAGAATLLPDVPASIFRDQVFINPVFMDKNSTLNHSFNPANPLNPQHTIYQQELNQMLSQQQHFWEPKHESQNMETQIKSFSDMTNEKGELIILNTTQEAQQTSVLDYSQTVQDPVKLRKEIQKVMMKLGLMSSNDLLEQLTFFNNVLATMTGQEHIVAQPYQQTQLPQNIHLHEKNQNQAVEKSEIIHIINLLQAQLLAGNSSVRGTDCINIVQYDHLMYQHGLINPSRADKMDNLESRNKTMQMKSDNSINLSKQHRVRQKRRGRRDNDRKLQSMKRSIEISKDGHYFSGIVQSLTLNHHSGYNSYSSLKKSVRGSFNQKKNLRFKNKPLSPLRVYVQTTKNEVSKLEAIPIRFDVDHLSTKKKEESQNDYHSNQKAYEQLHTDIKVPFVEHMDENNDMKDNQSPQSQQNTGLQYINSDINNVVVGGLEENAIDLITENEHIKAITNQLIQEYNQKYKYKLDQNYYFEEPNIYEGKKRPRSHSRDKKVNVATVAFNRQGHIQIKPAQQKKQQGGLSSQRVPFNRSKSNPKVQCRNMIQFVHFTPPEPLDTSKLQLQPQVKKINVHSLRDQRQAQQLLLQHAQLIEYQNHNIDKKTKLQMSLLKQQLMHPDLFYTFALIDHQSAMNVSQNRPLQIVKQTAHVGTHTSPMPAVTITKPDQEMSINTSQTRIISLSNKVPNISKQTAGRFHRKNLNSTEGGKQISIENQNSTLTRKLRSPDNRRRIYSSGEQNKFNIRNCSVSPPIHERMHSSVPRGNIQMTNQSKQRNGSKRGSIQTYVQTQMHIQHNTDLINEQTASFPQFKEVDEEYEKPKSSDKHQVLSIQSRHFTKHSKKSDTLDSAKSNTKSPFLDFNNMNARDEHTDNDDVSPQHIKTQPRFHMPQTDIHTNVVSDRKKIITAMQSEHEMTPLQQQDHLQSSKEIMIVHQQHENIQSRFQSNRKQFLKQNDSSQNSSELVDDYDAKHQLMMAARDKEKQNESNTFSDKISPLKQPKYDDRRQKLVKRRSLALKLPKKMGSMIIKLNQNRPTSSRQDKQADHQTQDQKSKKEILPSIENQDQLQLGSNLMLNQNLSNNLQTKSSIGISAIIQQQIDESDHHQSAIIQCMNNPAEQIHVLIHSKGANNTRSAGFDGTNKTQIVNKESFSPSPYINDTVQFGLVSLPITTNFQSLHGINSNIRDKKESSTHIKKISTNRGDEFSVAEISAQVMMDQHDIITDLSNKDYQSNTKLDQVLRGSKLGTNHNLSPQSQKSTDVYELIQEALVRQKMEKEAQLKKSKSKLFRAINKTLAEESAEQKRKLKNPIRTGLMRQDEAIPVQKAQQSFQVQGRHIYTIKQALAEHCILQLIQHHINSLQNDFAGIDGATNQYSTLNVPPLESKPSAEMTTQEKMIKNQKTLHQINMLYSYMEELHNQRASPTSINQTSLYKANSNINTGQSIKVPTSQSVNRRDDNATINTLKKENILSPPLNSSKMGSKANTSQLIERSTIINNKSSLNHNIMRNQQHNSKNYSGFSNSGLFAGAFGSDQLQFLKSPRMNHVQTISQDNHQQQAMLEVDNLVLLKKQPYQHPVDYNQKQSQLIVNNMYDQNDQDKNTMTKVLESIELSQEFKASQHQIKVAKKHSSNITMPEVKNSLKTEKGMIFDGLTKDFISSRERLKKIQTNSNDGRKTTILSKSINSIKGIRFNKESEELNYPMTVINTKNENTLENKDKQKKLRSEKGKKEVTSNRTALIDNRSFENKDNDGELCQSRFQLNQKFSEQEIKKLTIHDSDQHLSFYKITQPVLENSPRIKGSKRDPTGPYNEYNQMSSPVQSSDLLYSGRSMEAKCDKILDPGRISTQPIKSQGLIAANEIPPQTSKIRIIRSKTNEPAEIQERITTTAMNNSETKLQKVAPEIHIEQRKKSRGTTNGIYLQSQQYYKQAPDFKLPKQFEKMKDIFNFKPKNYGNTDTNEDMTFDMNAASVEKSDTKTRHIINSTNTPNELTRVIDVTKSRPSFNNQILNKFTDKKNELDSNRFQKQTSSQVQSPHNITQKLLSINDDLVSNKKHQQLLKTQSMLNTHLHVNKRSEQRENIQSVSINHPYSQQNNAQNQGITSQVSQNRISYLIKRPTQNEISTSRLMETTNALMANTSVKFNRLQSAIQRGAITDQFRYQQKHSRYTKGGLLPGDGFTFQNGPDAAIYSNYTKHDNELINYGSRIDIMAAQQVKKDKRIFSAVSQPSNTYASTGFKRSQPDHFQEHLSYFDNVKAQQEMNDNFLKGSLPLQREINKKTRPKTAKVNKQTSNNQNLQQQVHKNNRKLMRLESAHQAKNHKKPSLLKNESLAPSSSVKLIQSQKKQNKTTNLPSEPIVQTLISGTRVIRPRNYQQNIAYNSLKIDNFNIIKKQNQSNKISERSSNADIQDLMEASGNGYFTQPHPTQISANLKQSASNQYGLMQNPLLTQVDNLTQQTTKPNPLLQVSETFSNIMKQNEFAILSSNPSNQNFGQNFATADFNRLESNNYGSSLSKSFENTVFSGASRKPPLQLTQNTFGPEKRRITSAVSFMNQRSTKGSAPNNPRRLGGMLARGKVFKDQDFEAKQRDGRNGIIVKS